MAYLRNNPFVAVAAALAGSTVVAMVMTSILSLRFLRRLRAKAQPFWASHFGEASIGTLRLMGVTPAKVARISSQQDVHGVCDAYRGRFRLWRTISFVLIVATFAALFAAGGLERGSGAILLVFLLLLITRLYVR